MSLFVALKELDEIGGVGRAAQFGTSGDDRMRLVELGLVTVTRGCGTRDWVYRISDAGRAVLTNRAAVGPLLGRIGKGRNRDAIRATWIAPLPDSNRVRLPSLPGCQHCGRHRC